uniref:Si:ch73-335m24.2 n=1 Tax=Macrostomum lignano TaxID=282301 RepID=A0A1I8IBS2_9PLAT
TPFRIQGPYPGTCEPSTDYSQQQCSLAAFVRHVQRQCRCNYYEERSNWEPQLPHCTELLDNLTESLMQIRCVDQVEHSYTTRLANPCPVPCRRHLFNMDVSSADLDLPRWFLCFLQRPIFQNLNTSNSLH